MHLRRVVLSLVVLNASIAFAAAAEPAPKKLLDNRPQTIVPFDDGRVALFPETAEFYGDEIRINPDNFCIAWWSQAGDYVAWQVELPKAGEYEVWLEWSIADDQAGNAFVVKAGERQIEGKIGVTGGWTSFKRESAGVLKFPAGKSRVELRVSGELKGELADVRAVTLNPKGAAPPPGAPDVPAKTPAASLAAIAVHPSMQIELVASEPLVRDPIAIAWGPDLKLWVVEMGDYPLGQDGQGKPAGRVKFLEDTDDDGRYDKATLFLDGLSFPTGVLPWRKGVLVAAAPDIFYAADADGDGRAEIRKPILQGFPERNQQHRVNGLRWGLDNWVHCANGDGGVGGEATIKSALTGRELRLGRRDLRFRPDTGEIEPQSGPTQFGRNRDDWGHWFGSNNGQPLYHFALDEHYLARNERLAAPDPRVHLFNVGGPFFTRAPAIGFRGEPLAKVQGSRPVGMGGACSGMIYRDDLLGAEFAGNAFICDPVTNLVHRRILEPNGATFTSRRADDEANSEFFASSDPWTRPTMVEAGPDGALYVVDMYRLYIEHPQWINPSVLARADLRAGHDRGRIYRIYPRNARPRSVQPLDKLNTPELASALDSPSGWRRDIAQQLLVQRKDPAAAALLAKATAKSPRDPARLQALAALDGLGDVSEPVLLASLADEHPAMRRLALRLSEPRLDQSPKLASAVLALAESSDAAVAMQAAYSLGAWNDARAGEAIGKLIAAHAEDSMFVTAALSSATKQPAAVLAGFLTANPSPEAALLARVVKSCAAPEDRRFAELVLKQFAPSKDAEETARQLVLLAALIDAKLYVEDVGGPLVERAKQLTRQARELVSEATASEPLRVVAIGLLARDERPLAADVKLLLEQLSPSTPLPVAEAAIGRLSQLSDAAIAREFAARLTSLSPALRSRVFEALLVRREWSVVLLEHAAKDARLANSIDPSRRQRLLTAQNMPDVREKAARVSGRR